LSRIKYIRQKKISYWSKRYNKWVIVEEGRPSDGATGAIDIENSISWWVHDKLKETKKFEDGTRCSNFQASRIISDILWREKHYFRAHTWGIGTFIWGTGTFIYDQVSKLF